MSDEYVKRPYGIIPNEQLQVTNWEHLVLLEYRGLCEGVGDKILHRKLSNRGVSMVYELHQIFELCGHFEGVEGEVFGGANNFSWAWR